MSTGLNMRAIVTAVGEQAILRIERKVIASFQRVNSGMAGDDSELKTIWDEICAQVQLEESVCWDTYDETVRTLVADLVADLPQHEKEAAWLQTEEGNDWEWEDESQRETHPVLESDIVEHIVTHHIYTRAGEWTNARLRAYLDRASMTD